MRRVEYSHGESAWRGGICDVSEVMIGAVGADEPASRVRLSRGCEGKARRSATDRIVVECADRYLRAHDGERVHESGGDEQQRSASSH